VLSMVTDVKRPRKTDPGHPRQCNVCAFYKYFFDDWEHYWELCRKAQIGCYDKKKLLAERIIERFTPFREVRSELSPDQVNAILDEGSAKARDVARHTMREVRQAVGLPGLPDRSALRRMADGLAPRRMTRRTFIGWWMAAVLTAFAVTGLLPILVYFWPAPPKGQKQKPPPIALATDIH